MSEIISAAKEHVKILLDENLGENIFYHNWDHTAEVYEEAIDLAKSAQLNDDQLEILSLAALFHDTGFIKTYEDHETHSQEIATDYLKKIQYPESKIKEVVECIAATKMPHPPVDKTAALLQDADLSNLSFPSWQEKSNLLKKEKEAMLNQDFTIEEWQKENLDFMKNVVYTTKEGKLKYDEKKKINRDNLKDQVKRQKKSNSDSLINGNRTAELLFKTALRNHISLTQIADNKANIMLSINALILGFTIPQLLNKKYIAGDWIFIVIAICIGFTCVVSMVFAALSTQPGKFNGKFDLKDIQAGKGSLFFFGNFFNSSLEDYTAAMKITLSRENNLDDSAILDLYYLGKSLGRKFNLLRLCYTCFLIGFVFTTGLFLVLYLTYKVGG